MDGNFKMGIDVIADLLQTVINGVVASGTNCKGIFDTHVNNLTSYYSYLKPLEILMANIAQLHLLHHFENQIIP